MLVCENVYLPGSSVLLILLLLSQEALVSGLSLLVLSLTFPITSKTLSVHFSCYCCLFLKCSRDDGAKCNGKIEFCELSFF